jgi:hypothetical protein
VTVRPLIHPSLVDFLAHSSISFAGDEVYLVPEESQKDTPPSYALAQADAVPPYWETTVHAPSSPDDMIIDHLPTGSVFSFLWNLLISISFQFVGFLLTYLLHTTHAARFGSRAGLGVTLIQYGFALRSRQEEDTSNWWGVGGGPYGNGGQGDEAAPAKPTFGTKEEAEEYYRKLNITMVNGMPSGTIPGATLDDLNVANEATTDWVSFFLMTVGTFLFFLSLLCHYSKIDGRMIRFPICIISGWFILLTSLLGFWRVKRWERNILASQRETTVSGRDAAGQSHAFSTNLHRFVGMPVREVGSLVRTGLGFSRSSRGDAEGGDFDADVVEGGRAVPMTPLRPMAGEESARRELIIAMYAHDPERQRQIIQTFRDDDQLMADMRAAGML